MLTQTTKLETFLELALMGQQFPLVLTRGGADETDLRQALRAKGATPQTLSNPQALFAAQGGLILFRLTPENFDEVYPRLRAIRHKGVFETGGQAFRFAEELKILFTMDERAFAGLPSKTQDEALFIYSPIYRF